MYIVNNKTRNLDKGQKNLAPHLTLCPRFPHDGYTPASKCVKLRVFSNDLSNCDSLWCHCSRGMQLHQRNYRIITGTKSADVSTNVFLLRLFNFHLGFLLDDACFLVSRIYHSSYIFTFSFLLEIYIYNFLYMFLQVKCILSCFIQTCVMDMHEAQDFFKFYLPCQNHINNYIVFFR